MAEIIALLILLPLMGLLFFRAYASRKKYTCPNCGEQIQVELMEATRCSVCGSPLNQNREEGSHYDS